MGLLLSLLKPKILIGAAFTAVFCYAFYIAMDRKTLQQEIKNFKATEAQNNERKNTNETIRKADAARKCELLGGVFENGQCK